jgi:hypothetical protein
MSVGASATGAASPQARAIALAEIDKLDGWLKSNVPPGDSPEYKAHRAAALAEIERFRRDPGKFAPAPELPTPPGQPIGDDED